MESFEPRFVDGQKPELHCAPDDPIICEALDDPGRKGR